jgi:hypothetical protein
MTHSVFENAQGPSFLFEPSPCHRPEQIYFLTFVFLVRAVDP